MSKWTKGALTAAIAVGLFGVASQAMADDTIKIAIAGSTGRMGRMLIEAVLGAEGCELHTALDRAGSDAGKAQQSCDQRNHEEHSGVMEHFHSFR